MSFDVFTLTEPWIIGLLVAGISFVIGILIYDVFIKPKRTGDNFYASMFIGIGSLLLGIIGLSLTQIYQIHQTTTQTREDHRDNAAQRHAEIEYLIIEQYDITDATVIKELSYDPMLVDALVTLETDAADTIMATFLYDAETQALSVVGDDQPSELIPRSNTSQP